MIACITGATAGIGEATAIQLAKLNYDLIITGRRQDRLDKLANSLKSSHGISVHTLCFDIRNADETQKAISSLPEAFSNIDVLVNNAGLAAGLDPIQTGNLDHWDRMIDTNVKGLLYITRSIVPGMIERKAGHIVNIGSIAGKEVYANGNVYCASKHAVDALSRGMRLDLVQHGIKVTNIAPGLVETEFSLVRFEQDADKAKNVYKGMSPLTGADIADCVAFAITRPAHVVIGDLLVLPAAQGNSTTVIRK
jgi:NADP-dependent 3-hydroxy acid dehydrogenase YdfG